MEDEHELGRERERLKGLEVGGGDRKKEQEKVLAQGTRPFHAITGMVTIMHIQVKAFLLPGRSFASHACMVLHHLHCSMGCGLVIR